MNRLFSIVPPGLYTLTATVNGAPHAFSTSVPGTNPPQASDFFFATFSDVTVGTINQVVTFVSSSTSHLNVVYYLRFHHRGWRRCVFLEQLLLF
jgi:hypothetical protein